jgi:hypothetical protein
MLESLFANDHKKSKAGRKPIDPVFMLKVLFLQRLYNISDNQVEYQIKDRMSMKGLFFRGVGIVRATFYIGFTNLVYNMCRLVQIKKYHPDWIMN